MILLLLACGQKEPAQAAPPPEPVLLGVDVKPPEPPKAIEVSHPTPGTVLVPGEELKVSGSATVWEGALVVELAASDELMVKELVTASSAAPGRGSFELAIPVPEGQSGGPWTLKVYSSSPKDGSPINVVEVPLSGP